MIRAAPMTTCGMKRLSEAARHLIKPTGITHTGWGPVLDTCNKRLGIQFDEWQDGAGRLILSKRADGKLAAMVGGVGMSLPRQVGKTYLLSGLLFGLCVNTPGLLVIWTAHHGKTGNETFLSMQGFAARPRVKPFIAQIFVGSGDEEIRFRNGSRILFGARERGFGRGIPGVDVLVMDEAQIMSDKALEAMLATMNVSTFGLALYVGTPPRPEDNSEAFTRMRTEALSGEATDMVWIECSADDNADLDDPKQWTKANPSFPHRTPPESIKRMRKKLSDDGFRHEALGIWDDDAAVPFNVAKWAGLARRSIDSPDRVALVVDVSPDRRWASVGVAGEVDGRVVVMCHRDRGTAWVAPKVGELVARHDVAEVALTPDQAKVIKPALVGLGIDFVTLTRGDVGASCAAMQEAVKSRTVVHVGQPELDAAIANARTRYAGEVELWDRREPGIDISPAISCAAAFYRWGLQDAPLPAIY